MKSKVHFQYDQCSAHNGIDYIEARIVGEKPGVVLILDLMLQSSTCAYQQPESEIELNISLYDSQSAFDDKNIEIPDLYKMNESEFFQHSLVQPYYEYNDKRIDLELVRAIIKFSYKQYQSFTRCGDYYLERWVTFEY